MVSNMKKNIITDVIKANGSNPITKDKFIGIVVMLTLSRDFFSKNTSVSSFINEVFGLNFLNYAVRSRTLMCAKVSRHINDLCEDELKKSIYKMKEVIMCNAENFNIEIDEVSTKPKTHKKKNAFNNMNKWMNDPDKEYLK